MNTKETSETDISEEVNATKIHNVNQVFSTIAKSTLMPAIRIAISPETQNALKIAAEISKKIYATISPIVKLIGEIDFTPIYEAVEILKKSSPAGVDYNALIKRCMQVLYQYRWFPASVYTCRISFFFELVDILNSTREGSKNRGRKVDSLMFSYYDKQVINGMKRACRMNNELNPSYKRLILEALNAYQKGKYGTTVFVLTMLWQGMISLKVDNRVYQSDSKIRESLKKLVYLNGEEEIYAEFFNTFIYYECSDFDKVKEDVPGRHGIAHGWMKEYPNRKMALNAVLFTEFLANLQPIK